MNPLAMLKKIAYYFSSKGNNSNSEINQMRADYL